MGRVSLVKTHAGVKDSLVEALDLIGGLGRCLGHDDRIMLKPNLNGVEGCTDRTLVESLIQLLSDFGVSRVLMAESTFGDARMTEALFRQTGYRELAKKYGLELHNLNESQAVEVDVERPLVLEKLRIAKEVFEVDAIINLPNMKVHYATGVTLALKNLKGLLVGDEKRHFHEVGLDKAIVDLNSTIHPRLNIVDAISCMERMGPRGGDVVRLDLIIAGESAVEVDCVGSAVMGYALDEVRHLRYAIDAQGVDPAAIEVVGKSIDAVKHPFKKVQSSGIIPEKLTVHDSDACSSCMNAFLLSCQLLDGAPSDDVDVFMGSTIVNGGASKNKTLAFGNCCPEDRSFDIRIKGCPPYPFALGKSLKRMASGRQ
jgi:uncharacterized protein (DUF362 family)